MNTCLTFLLLNKNISSIKKEKPEPSLQSKALMLCLIADSPCGYLSARTSKGLVPRDQLRTIQAESIAARKPRAIPVPIGQKGWKGTENTELM